MPLRSSIWAGVLLRGIVRREGVREGVSKLLRWKGGRFSRFKGQFVHGCFFVSRRRASHSAVSPLAVFAVHGLLIEGPLAVPSRSVGVSVGSRPGLGFVMVDRVLCGGSRTGLVLLIVRRGHERPLCGGVSAVLSWSYRALIKRSGTSGPGVFLFFLLGRLSRYRVRLDSIAPRSGHSRL